MLSGLHSASIGFSVPGWRSNTEWKAIISSAELKARETAAILAARLGQTPGVDADLNEHARDNVPYLSRLVFEAAIRRYLDGEITLGRAAELAGMTRWRFQEMLKQRGVRVEIETRPARIE